MLAFKKHNCNLSEQAFSIVQGHSLVVISGQLHSYMHIVTFSTAEKCFIYILLNLCCCNVHYDTDLYKQEFL